MLMDAGRPPLPGEGLDADRLWNYVFSLINSHDQKDWWQENSHQLAPHTC